MIWWLIGGGLLLLALRGSGSAMTLEEKAIAVVEKEHPEAVSFIAMRNDVGQMCVEWEDSNGKKDTTCFADDASITAW